MHSWVQYGNEYAFLSAIWQIVYDFLIFCKLISRVYRQGKYQQNIKKRYDLLLAPSSTSITDPQYLGTIQIWWISTNRRKLFSIPVTEYASFSYQTRSLETDLLQFNISFFKFHFKTDTLLFLFLSSHICTALEYESDYFGILLWK